MSLLINQKGSTIMSDTVNTRAHLLPGMLRKGDVVNDIDPTGRARIYRLTDHPTPGTVVCAGMNVPVYYLTGTDDRNGYKVMVVKVARMPVDTSRETALKGRPAPTFYRPEPTFVY